MAISEFYRKKVNGDKSETRIKQLLEQSNLWIVEDVSKNPEYFHKGDFRVYDEFGLFDFMVDAKCDWEISKYGNFCFEVGIDRLDGRGECDGWFKRASYDYLAFDNTKDCIIYILDFKRCQQIVESIKCYEFNRYKDSEEAYLHNYLVRVNKAKECGLVLAEYRYSYDDNGQIVFDKTYTRPNDINSERKGA